MSWFQTIYQKCKDFYNNYFVNKPMQEITEAMNLLQNGLDKSNNLRNKCDEVVVTVLELDDMKILADIQERLVSVCADVMCLTMKYSVETANRLYGELWDIKKDLYNLQCRLQNV